MAADSKIDQTLPPEIGKYLAILSKDPGSMLFAPLAEAYRKAGMLDEAIATARDGLDLHPNYVSGMVALGRAYFEKGLLLEAEETLGRVLSVSPDNIVAGNILTEIRKQSAVGGRQSETTGRGTETEGEAEEIRMEERPYTVEEEEADLIELEEIEALEEVEAEEESVSTYGEEITDELWTGESITEEVKVEEKDEEVRPKKEITTSTIAELYIKQGYLDKAIDIYQAISDANPFNEEIKRKLDELKGRQSNMEEEGPVAGGREPEKPLIRVAEPDVNEKILRLESWLRTIRSERRRI